MKRDFHFKEKKTLPNLENKTHDDDDADDKEYFYFLLSSLIELCERLYCHLIKKSN